MFLRFGTEFIHYGKPCITMLIEKTWKGQEILKGKEDTKALIKTKALPVPPYNQPAQNFPNW